jgi:hypothetical protein
MFSLLLLECRSKFLDLSAALEKAFTKIENLFGARTMNLSDQSQFPHSCICERFIYSQDRSTYFLQKNCQID